MQCANTRIAKTDMEDVLCDPIPEKQNKNKQK